MDGQEFEGSTNVDEFERPESSTDTWGKRPSHRYGDFVGSKACGARKVCRRRSGGISVLVYESVASAGSQHGEGCWGSLGRLIGRCRWLLVEEFSSDGSDPAFGERVGHGRSHGSFEHLHALGLEDLVEAVDELAASIADQSPGGFEPIAVGDEQVAGGLCAPGSGWVGGEDLPDGGLVDRVSEAGEFALDAAGERGSDRTKQGPDVVGHRRAVHLSA